VSGSACLDKVSCLKDPGGFTADLNGKRSWTAARCKAQGSSQKDAQSPHRMTRFLLSVACPSLVHSAMHCNRRASSWMLRKDEIALAGQGGVDKRPMDGGSLDDTGCRDQWETRSLGNAPRYSEDLEARPRSKSLNPKELSAGMGVGWSSARLSMAADAS
jgi:hypothetical protein